MDILEYKNFLHTNCGSAWVDHGIFAAELVKLLKPEVVVDLGVDEGYSTFCFAAYNIGEIYGIDAFTGDQLTGSKNTLSKVIKMQYYVKEKYGISNVNIIPGFFDDIAAEWTKPIDILHIDGFHSYEAVENDFYNWTKFCHNNSLILFHDVNFYMNTVGEFFYNTSGYKFVRDQSAGLGILTQNKDLYLLIKNLSENCPG